MIINTSKRNISEKIALQSKENEMLISEKTNTIISKSSEDVNKKEVKELPKITKDILDINEILSSIIKSIPKINLMNVLRYDIGDDLEKYEAKKKSNRDLEDYDIPNNLFIVAMVYKMHELAQKKGWDLAKENEDIYLFNGKYWTKCPKDNLYQFLEDIAIAMNFYSPAVAKTTRFKEDFYKQFITSANFYTPNSNKNITYLNCKNGTLEITQNSINLVKHNKEHFLKYMLDFNYNENAKSPIFDKYLSEVLDYDSSLILQEFCGYIFVSKEVLKLEKCLVCYGEGANGKSVFFEVLTSLLGKNNISTKSLGDLTDNSQGHYNRATIKDALVNYGSEIKGKNIDVDIFKRLTSGEPVNARLPYKEPFDLENNTKLIFNANELPKLDEHNEAIFRRFIIIPFDKIIPEDKRDVELHSKIINNELSGVLNWVIVGLKRLLENKVFSKSVKVEQSLETYKKESDTVAMFIEENGYINSIDNHISISTLYEDYRIDVKENGQLPLSKINFCRRLRKLNFSEHRNGKIRGFLIEQKS